MEQDTAIAVLQEQVASLKDRVTSIEIDVQQKFDRLEAKLDEALKGRPTWAVTIIITTLATICTGLAVAFLTRR